MKNKMCYFKSGRSCTLSRSIFKKYIQTSKGKKLHRMQYGKTPCLFESHKILDFFFFFPSHWVIFFSFFNYSDIFPARTRSPQGEAVEGGDGRRSGHAPWGGGRG